MSMLPKADLDKGLLFTYESPLVNLFAGGHMGVSFFDGTLFGMVLKGNKWKQPILRVPDVKTLHEYQSWKAILADFSRSGAGWTTMRGTGTASSRPVHGRRDRDGMVALWVARANL